MLGSLRGHRQGRWAQVPALGLLLEGRRKSMQPEAERLPDGAERALQQFLNRSDSPTCPLPLVITEPHPTHTAPAYPLV